MLRNLENLTKIAHDFGYEFGFAPFPSSEAPLGRFWALLWTLPDFLRPLMDPDALLLAPYGSFGAPPGAPTHIEGIAVISQLFCKGAITVACLPQGQGAEALGALGIRNNE